MNRPILKYLVCILALIIAGGSYPTYLILTSGKSFSGSRTNFPAEFTSIKKELEDHVKMLSETIGDRNTKQRENLEKSAIYIENQLHLIGLDSKREEIELADEEPVYNILAEKTGYGPLNERKTIVIGAHYDSATPDCPGANDNASGVAAMLGLAKIISETNYYHSIRFVAFVNEEQPYFFTSEMGSFVNAKNVALSGEKILGMISLETMGYYSKEEGSQKYPVPIFKKFYPSAGNFIGFISNFSSSLFMRDILIKFRETAQIPSQGVVAPEFVPGVGWSDHQAFWDRGYPAIMITDTALFRYPHYHESTDTYEKLDYGAMAEIVLGLGEVMKSLGRIETPE